MQDFLDLHFWTQWPTTAVALIFKPHLQVQDSSTATVVRNVDWEFLNQLVADSESGE